MSVAPVAGCPSVDATAATFSPPRRSLTALSSTLSASSSLSGSNKTEPYEDNPHLSSRFKHYHRPTVSESPYLVSLVERYIVENNVEGLAKVARNRGLPPSLRQYAWPLLLSTHPFVMEPSIQDEFPDDPARISEEHHREVPYKRIKGEISRLRLKLSKSKSYSTKASNSSFSTSGQGSPGISSPKDGSAVSSQMHGDIAAEAVAARLEDQKFEFIEQAVCKFLEKYQSKVPYDPGLIWCASALAEWVHPIYEMQPVTQSRKRTHSGSSSTTTASTESIDGSSSEFSSPELTAVQAWDTNKFSFASTFESLMLVILHSPARGSDGPTGPLDSPINERGMLFVTAIRYLLPELSVHFDEEHILTSIGGDDWLIWWIKWYSAKVWNKHDVGRLWDMYLGWRPHECVVDHEDEANILNVSSDERQQGLGVDPFWNPNDLDKSARILDPCTQHLFVCISMLKSVKPTLLELDTSEIRQFLVKFPKAKDIESIISAAGEVWRSWQWKEETESSD